MGKRNLCTSIIVGAVVGGLFSLFNKETRSYTKSKLSETKDYSIHYLKNPSDSLRKTRQRLSTWTNLLDENIDGAINALDQIEDTLRKISK